MRPRTVIYRGQRRSRSARQLGRETGFRVVRTTGSRFVARPTDTIINWGYGGEVPPRLAEARWINPPGAVATAVCKLASFQRLRDEGVSVPDFTTDREEAETWRRDGHIVVVRRDLRGNCGRGIEVYAAGENGPRIYPASTGVPEQLVQAPLFVKYYRAFDEYRIHVFRGRVIDTQQKRRRRDHDNVTEVRSHANGWVFCREEVEAPAGAYEEAIRAVHALGLDFAAVDLRVKRSGECAVLECNTAPGLEGSSAARYAAAISVSTE